MKILKLALLVLIVTSHACCSDLYVKVNNEKMCFYTNKGSNSIAGGRVGVDNLTRLPQALFSDARLDKNLNDAKHKYLRSPNLIASTGYDSDGSLCDGGSKNKACLTLATTAAIFETYELRNDDFNRWKNVDSSWAA